MKWCSRFPNFGQVGLITRLEAPHLMSCVIPILNIGGGMTLANINYRRSEPRVGEYIMLKIILTGRSPTGD